MGFEKNLIHFDVAFEWRISVYHGKSELFLCLINIYWFPLVKVWALRMVNEKVEGV